MIGGIGLGGGIRTYYRQVSILRDKSRALKAADQWILGENDGKAIVATNRATQQNVRIPKSAIRPSLRRHSGVGYLDISERTDFLVVNDFKGIGRFIPQEALLKRFMRDIKPWKKYVESRLCNLIVLRKFDFSAKGTSVFAFFTSVPAVPGDLWGLSGLNLEEAKILAAWYNSTPNLLQMFLNRTETRGAWMKIDASTLEQSYVLNSKELSTSQRSALLTALDEISSLRCPSILEQLNNRFEPRVNLDSVILRLLGFAPDQVEKISKSMYPKLASEIGMLKELMEGGNDEESELENDK